MTTEQTTPPVPSSMVTELKRLTLAKPFLFSPNKQHGDLGGYFASLKRADGGKYAKRRFKTALYTHNGVDGIGIWRIK
jgi:hypothetical protein